MRRRSKAWLIGASWLAIWLPARPALAWGPLMHGVVADRCYAELVPRAPWLASQRDAFLWGALAADVAQAPGAGPLNRVRLEAPETLTALWRYAGESGDRSQAAFVLGWAAHAAAEARMPAFLTGLAPRVGTGPLASTEPATTLALAEWAVDAALLPRHDTTLRELARAAAMHIDLPAGAAIGGMLSSELGIEPSLLAGWARLLAVSCGGGPERFLAVEARFRRLPGDPAALQEAAVRQALGDLTPWITSSVDDAVAAARGLANAGI